MESTEHYRPFWNTNAPVKEQARLARYVLEPLDEIARVVKEAEEDLKAIPPWNDPSFDAYVSGDPGRVRAQVAALFARLQKGKPAAGPYQSYRVEPPQSWRNQQRLRLAREILREGHS